MESKLEWHWTPSQDKRVGRATIFTQEHRKTKSAEFCRGHEVAIYLPSESTATSQLATTPNESLHSIEAPLRLTHGLDSEGVRTWLGHVPANEVRVPQIASPNGNTMSKQSFLPTGRAFAPAPIPQYITSEQQQSGDSCGSLDSVRTQIPLPYHLPNDAVQGQSQSWGTTAASGQQIGNDARPWGTPNMSGSSNFENTRSSASGSSRSLNPTSAPYIPPGYPPTLSNHNTYGNNAGLNSSFQQPAQPGGMSYQSSNAFGQGQNSGGVHLQGPYDGSPAVNPYAHFGPSAGMNGYNPYNAGNGLPTNSYGASTAVSPTMSHAPMAPAQSSYQNLPYGPGTGAGVLPPTEYMPAQNGYAGANQGWASMYTPPTQYQSQHPVPLYVNPANIHRGKPPYASGRQAVGQSALGHGHPTSNLATAPVMNFAGNSNVKAAVTFKEKFGAPVIPPSQATRLDASPAKSAIEPFCTHTASPSRRSTANPDAAPTPGLKNQPLDIEFSSEPRNNMTPNLRSRRGQTITNAVTDPSRKQATSNWLDNIPNLAPLDPQGSNVRAMSPPKMLLIGSGAGDAKALSTISENDPFVGPPRSRAATVHNNPFAPKPQAPSPYAVGNRLIGPPSGPSAHLRALTSSGTRYPSLAEALDPKNFPFIETCRLSKEDNAGVIKIKNVSCPSAHLRISN